MHNNRNTTARYLASTIATGMLVILSTTLEAAQSKIYRSVDKDGNVVFTDIAPKIDGPNETVELGNTNSFEVEEALGQRQEWVVEGAGSEGAESEAVGSNYTALVIQSPANDETIRENTGNLTVVAALTPEIRPGHRLRLLLDGVLVGEGSQAVFDLLNIDRGSHTLTTELVDQSGTVLISSSTTTFHMMRYAQPQPKPAPRS